MWSCRSRRDRVFRVNARDALHRSCPAKSLASASSRGDPLRSARRATRGCHRRRRKPRVRGHAPHSRRARLPQTSREIRRGKADLSVTNYKRRDFLLPRCRFIRLFQRVPASFSTSAPCDRARRRVRGATLQRRGCPERELARAENAAGLADCRARRRGDGGDGHFFARRFGDRGRRSNTAEVATRETRRSRCQRATPQASARPPLRTHG